MTKNAHQKLQVEDFFVFEALNGLLHLFGGIRKMNGPVSGGAGKQVIFFQQRGGQGLRNLCSKLFQGVFNNPPNGITVQADFFKSFTTGVNGNNLAGMQRFTGLA